MDEQLFHKFLNWERATRDTIDFKKIYVDMAGDHLAGLVLSEIVFWHLPNGQGASKLRIHRDNNDWIACTRYEWWDRTRLTPRQIDRIIKQLVKINLVYKKTFHFAGAPTLHVRINWEAFFALWDSLVAAPLENPYAPKNAVSHHTVKYNENANSSAISPNGKLPNGEIHITESVKTYTETTNRDKEKDSAPADAGAAGEPDLKLVQPDKPKRKKQEPKPRPANPVFDTMALMSYRIPKGTAIPKKAQGHIAGLTGAAREAWQSIFGEIDTDRLCKAIVVFYEREYDSKNLARVTNVAAFGGQFTGFLQRYKNNPNGATQHHNPLTGLKIITADTDERSA